MLHNWIIYSDSQPLIQSKEVLTCELLNNFYKGHLCLEHCPRLNLSVAGFPGGTVVENLPANAGDTGSSPGLGRSHMPRSN